MKIKMDRDQLLAGIGVVGNIVSQRATLPILSNMLLECSLMHSGFRAVLSDCGHGGLT